MKTVYSLLAGFSLLALSGQVLAQGGEEQKPLNNPMYSTHNYKHPNMATKARTWESKTGVTVKQPTPTTNRYANYKNQMPNAKAVGGITIEHAPSANVADRNYKIQRVSQPMSPVPANEYYVKKPKSSDSNVGN